MLDPFRRGSKRFPLGSIDALVLRNVTSEPATLHGKKGVRLTMLEDAKRKLADVTLEARNQTHIDRSPIGDRRHPTRIDAHDHFDIVSVAQE